MESYKQENIGAIMSAVLASILSKANISALLGLQFYISRVKLMAAMILRWESTQVSSVKSCSVSQCHLVIIEGDY